MSDGPATTFELPQSRCMAAVQRIDITPPAGIYHRMWGAAAHDRATGVHRPLTATVLALAGLPGGGRWLAIAVDHCLLWHEEMQTLLDRVSRQAELPRDELVVFFSHTHAAGLMGLERTELPGGDLIPPYLESLASQLAAAARAAVDQLQAATIVYASGRCSLAQNRDYLDQAIGRPVCGFNPGGTADDTVVVARISGQHDETLGTVVNYACHPTTLAWDNTLISPDFVGATRELVESATAAPCLFVQGASGDVGPRDGFVGDVEVADRNGRQLGYAALEAIESMPAPGTRLAYAGAVLSGATIGAWQSEPSADVAEQQVFRAGEVTVPLPYRHDLPDRDELLQELDRWRAAEQQARDAGDQPRAAEARAMAERATRRLVRVKHVPPGDSFPYRLRAWRMGRAVWLALNGEHYGLLQRTLRQRFSGSITSRPGRAPASARPPGARPAELPDLAIVVGTLANGSDVWYLPDAASYGKGLYQEDASILARGSLETLIAAAEQLIRDLQ